MQVDLGQFKNDIPADTLLPLMLCGKASVAPCDYHWRYTLTAFSLGGTQKSETDSVCEQAEHAQLCHNTWLKAISLACNASETRRMQKMLCRTTAVAAGCQLER